MKKHTETLECNTFYHVYNRGINGEFIFKKESHFAYFLLQYSKYIEPVANTYAYCLLNNHFHLLIKTKSEMEIIEGKRNNFNKLENWIPEESLDIKSGAFYISNQFAKLFNSYSQAFNKDEKRTGSLFDSPFRRIKVLSDSYFSQVVFYIHNNPQKHGLISNFRDYYHSSYRSHLLTEKTKLKREELLKWFGNRDQYEIFHGCNHDEKNIDKLIIEF